MLNSSTLGSAMPTRSLIKRFGLAGFMFFFLKGLAWLSVPALLTLLR